MTFYRSTTDDHDGWVFYKCKKHTVTYDFWCWELEYMQHLIETRVLIGNADVDAFGAAHGRREEPKMKRNEANAGKGALLKQAMHDESILAYLVRRTLPPSSKLLCCLDWVEKS
ncbi:Aldehyde dehydrogenase family 2 member B4, mitochondrial [Hordeum vulgare]|nr:Aldehyde dehydrogenase family 2 member B4, mitochondrial [Hordeum vulgare]KAE8814567.1 Aldehyde dehydrogenase family 2 member B4, mitochondrial [Hordeum vulgare]